MRQLNTSLSTFFSVNVACVRKSSGSDGFHGRVLEMTNNLPSMVLAKLPKNQLNI